MQPPKRIDQPLNQMLRESTTENEEEILYLLVSNVSRNIYIYPCTEFAFYTLTYKPYVEKQHPREEGPNTRDSEHERDLVTRALQEPYHEPVFCPSTMAEGCDSTAMVSNLTLDWGTASPIDARPGLNFPADFFR